MTEGCRLRAIVASVALLSGYCAAGAATVSKESGSVLINDGSGFVPIEGDVQLSPGSRVLVKLGGSALITYSGNCSVRVGSGQVSVIKKKPPCAKEASAQDVAPAPSGSTNEGGFADSQGGVPTGMLVVGGVAIAAGVGIALASNHGNNDSVGGDPDPASP